MARILTDAFAAFQKWKICTHSGKTILFQTSVSNVPASSDLLTSPLQNPLA
jgi:hypothetical protein